MADAPDDKRRTDAAKKPWDASAPLDFEKTSVEDAKRTISETQASFHATSAAQQAANNVLLDTTAAWFGQLPAACKPWRPLMGHGATSASAVLSCLPSVLVSCSPGAMLS